MELKEGQLWRQVVSALIMLRMSCWSSFINVSWQGPIKQGGFGEACCGFVWYSLVLVGEKLVWKFKRNFLQLCFYSDLLHWWSIIKKSVDLLLRSGIRQVIFLLFLHFFIFLNFSKEYIFSSSSLGLLYDVYYLHDWAFHLLILPLLTVAIYHFLFWLLSNRWTRVLAIIITIVFFWNDQLCFCIFLAPSKLYIPWFYYLCFVPTLVFNAFLFYCYSLCLRKSIYDDLEIECNECVIYIQNFFDIIYNVLVRRSKYFYEEKVTTSVSWVRWSFSQGAALVNVKADSTDDKIAAQNSINW